MQFISQIDIFRKDFIRGISGTTSRPDKKSLFIKDPQQNIKIFLRIVVFIHNKPNSFLVVKTSWKKKDDFSWEPPKGGVEEKDNTNPDLLEVLKNAVRRETFEEAKIKHLDNLTYTGFFLQGKEKEYDENTFFQYHIFKANVSDLFIELAKKNFDFFRKNKEIWDNLPKEYREKNAIGFFRNNTKIVGRWSPILVDFYMTRILPHQFS